MSAGPPSTATPNRRRPLAALTVAFAISRLVAYLAGVRFDDSVLRGTPLTDMWQLLDVRLLRSDLLNSVWHLDSQPPLFNLYAGFLLHLPSGVRRPTEVAVALLLGMVLTWCTYLLQIELGVPSLAALLVTVVGIVASPAYLLYENWLNYAYPTAVLATVAAWCLIRFLRSPQIRFGLGWAGCMAAIVLLSSSYQVEWMAVATIPVIVVLRHQWRLAVAILIGPLLVVLAWYVKDAAQVGTVTTSDWLGMNLARSVLYRAPADQVAALQRQGHLDALASVPPFAGPHVYSPRYVAITPSTIAAVGALTKADGATNFNNPLYASVATRYLHDDLVWIQAHPRAYVDDVAGSGAVWLVATDQNFTNSVNWPAVRGYAWLYDKSVEWQPVQNPAPGFVVFSRGWHRPAWLSIQAIAVYLLALGVIPLLAWRRRRRDPAWSATLAVLWWTSLYALATSTLFEIGENERFRSELGPIPLILAVVVVTESVRWVRSRRRAPRPRP